jgi:hypothetical protein
LGSSGSKTSTILFLIKKLRRDDLAFQQFDNLAMMAAIRMLFSWLTEKGAMNPAREVKTERFSRTEGKTPAFVEGEVQKLLNVAER